MAHIENAEKPLEQADGVDGALESGDMRENASLATSEEEEKAARLLGLEAFE